jgi:hypothetical protein
MIKHAEVEARIAVVRQEKDAAHARKGKSFEARAARQRAYYRENRDAIREQQRRYRASRRGTRETES